MKQLNERNSSAQMKEIHCWLTTKPVSNEAGSQCGGLSQGKTDARKDRKRDE
jgi:hypothetical protein